MKRILNILFISVLTIGTSIAQTEPAGLSVSNITDHTATVSWQASTTAPTTSTKIESFDQPFGTSFWNSGGYNWSLTNSDTRNYNGTVRSGSASWNIFRNDNSLTFNTVVALKGFWIYPSDVTSYTIKGYNANDTELYSKTTNVSFSFGYEYVTLNWNNVKKINISFVGTDIGFGSMGTVYVDDLEYTPSENLYPYYLSTDNTAPTNNETASGLATGISMGLTGLQTATTYYLWMRTYNGLSYGSWTASPVSFVTTNVLPIVLKDFTVKKDKNSAVLKWTTQSEQNNKAFIISHATDGKNFKVIAEVQGKGTTSNVSDYQYAHLSPVVGTNYYQLQQVDFNGDMKDLGIRTVEFKLGNSISVYPNPVVEKVTIAFNVGYNLIEITDLNGKVLQRINLGNTETSKDISLAQYPAAMYFIKLVGANKTETRKLIKQY